MSNPSSVERRALNIERATFQMNGLANDSSPFHIDAVLEQLLGEVRALQQELIKPTIPSPRRLRKRSKTIARYAVAIVEWVERRNYDKPTA